MARHDEAFTAAQAADRPPAHWGSHLALHELVEAAERSGRRDVAADALTRISVSAQASGSDWALGIEARSRALLTDGEPAQGLYLEAIERLVRSPVRPEAARAHLLYGEWLFEHDRRADARRHLRTAHDQLTAIGMEAFADRAARGLAAAGDGVRARTPATIGELTAQELQIARLVADGRTNQEIGNQLFLSARTIEWHLRKVFTKLDVRSRRAVRERMTQSG
jgi:DNA-binding CsgD family transcriptional regulator